MNRSPLSDDELERLAVFPLQGVVLFPHTVQPLHVFEARYCSLVQDCLDEDRPLALWQVDEARGRTPFGPGLQQVATAGRIVVHHELPDGRHSVVVEGLERVRLVEELEPEGLYRVVRSRRHPMCEPDPRAVAARIETLQLLARSLLSVQPRAARLVQVTLLRLPEATDQQELSDVLCSLTFEDGSARQGLLEQSDVVSRLDRVIESLSGLVLRRATATPSPEAWA